ncbi:MAG TPA: P-loop NTPase fold protein [Nitrososphaeraceae archaeon]|nr:P-loop NTPase fold protein [Nitrososphaeraceae archaeon]
MVITTTTTNKQEDKKNESTYKIITDEYAKDAFSFIKQSKRLTNIIVNSKARFTVGIFGGWGTGKTTMIQIIKNCHK